LLQRIFRDEELSYLLTKSINEEMIYIRLTANIDYLYLRNFKPERWPVCNPETGYLNCDGSPTKTYILDTRRKKGMMEYWQLNFGKREVEELYNIKDDPFCMKNLAGIENFAELKIKMETEMIQKLTEQGDPRVLGNGDVFDNYPYQGEVQNYYNRFMAGEKVKAGWVNETDYEEAPLQPLPNRQAGSPKGRE
jgi:hypothetical protein